ncbi:hypothetical protein LCGC14_1038740 [marine sediment metagenome]|uniref:Terminase small subunit n=1 Tax=marine sediment metagenome TaxID=412755 RepID=A0A0F9QYI7_9ZZZZ
MINEKRKRFCEEYIKDLNGKEAAIRAGYSERTAKQEAYKLLNDPGVSEHLAKLQKKTSKRNEITIDELIQDLLEMNNVNIADLYDKKGKMKNISDLPRNLTKCIQEIQITRAGTKYKFYSRLEVLEKLAKHLGFYEKDNRQSKPEIKLEFPYNINVESREKPNS